MGIFALLAAMRLLLGHGPRIRTTYLEFWWDLKVFWFHRGFPEWFVFFLLLAGTGALAFLFIREIARGRGAPPSPSQEPKPEPKPGPEPSPKKPARKLSEGAVAIFLLGLMCALGGTVLCYLPYAARAPWPPVLFAAGAVILIASTFTLLARWPKTFGQPLILPGIALAAIGTIIWLSREVEPPRNPWEDTPDLSRLCRSGIDNYVKGCASDRLPGDERRAAYAAADSIEKELLSMGEAGVRGILEFESPDCWWTKALLFRFGEDTIPILLEGLHHPYHVARRRSVSVLSNWAHDHTIARAVVPSLSDPDDIVRYLAAKFFSDGSDEKGSRPPAVHLDRAARGLQKLMFDRDADLRRYAFETLRYQKPEAVWPGVRDLLRIEADRSVRKEALLTLARVRNPDAFRTLVHHLDPEVHFWVVDEVTRDRKLGAKELEILVELLGTSAEDPAQGILRTDAFSVEALPDTCLDRLVELAAGPDPELRRTALRVLSSLADPRAKKVARAALETEDMAWVLVGLRRQGLVTDAELTTLLETRFEEIYAHYFLWPKDVALADPLQRRVLAPKTPTRERTMALHWLSIVDSERASRLAARLLHEHPEKISLSRLLSYLPAPELVPILQSKEDLDCAAAFYRLEDLDFRAAGPKLVDLIREESSSHLRRQAIRLVGTWRVAEAVPELIRIVAKAQPEDRPRGPRPRPLLRDALVALGDIGDPRAKERLRAAWTRAREANEVQTSYVAATSLLMTGETEVVPFLRSAFRRPLSEGWCACGSGTSCRAARAIAGLPDQAGVTPLLEILEEPKSRAHAAEALGRTGSERALQPLLALLRDPDPRVRRQAALGLGHLGKPEAFEALLALGKDPVPEVSNAAFWAAQTVSGQDFGMKLSENERHVVEPVKKPETPQVPIWPGPKAAEEKGK